MLLGLKFRLGSRGSTIIETTVSRTVVASLNSWTLCIYLRRTDPVVRSVVAIMFVVVMGVTGLSTVVVFRANMSSVVTLAATLRLLLCSEAI